MTRIGPPQHTSTAPSITCAPRRPARRADEAHLDALRRVGIARQRHVERRIEQPRNDSWSVIAISAALGPSIRLFERRVGNILRRRSDGKVGRDHQRRQSGRRGIIGEPLRPHAGGEAVAGAAPKLADGEFGAIHRVRQVPTTALSPGATNTVAAAWPEASRSLTTAGCAAAVADLDMRRAVAMAAEHLAVLRRRAGVVGAIGPPRRRRDRPAPVARRR